MEKFIYLCGMMLLSMNMMAQIDTNDLNWRCVLNETFDEGSSYWQWGQQSFVNPSQTWRAYPGSGVTHGSEYQVYQPSQCQIDVTNQCMELVAEYDSEGRIPDNDYDLPSWMWPSNDGPGYPDSDGLSYFSGSINYINRNSGQRTPESGIFRYGYFEIRCKLPTHQGAFPAFWLWAADPESDNDKFYEEIDIFEYSWSLGDPDANWLHPTNPHPTRAGDRHIITCGIYHNLTGEGPNDDHWDSYGRVYSGNKPDVGADFHVYGCEWMPDHVYWFFDGQLVNSYTNPEHIPCHPLILKANYAIDGYFDYENGIWTGSDNMIISYIKAYELKTSCDENVSINSINDWNNFIPNLKGTISLGEFTIPSNSSKTMRASESIIFNNGFAISQGSQVTFMVHECPE